MRKFLFLFAREYIVDTLPRNCDIGREFAIHSRLANALYCTSAEPAPTAREKWVGTYKGLQLERQHI